jgi:hypothetical protein
MKELRRSLFIALLAFSLVFVSCSTTSHQVAAQQEAVTLQTLQSSVAVIDKYGNCTLTLTEQELTDAGYTVGDVATITIGDFTYEAPIGTAYSDVDKGNYLIRLSKGSVILAINYGNLTKTSGAKEGDSVSIGLLDKGGYLQEFELRHLVRTDERKDYASDAIFANFRNVKFGSIAPNRLYRSANPVLGDERAPYAEALAKLVGIRTVINLADNQESLYANLDKAPFYKGLVESGSVIALDMGVTFTDPEFIAKLKTGLAFMAEHKGPYLIHCNEGKDRAGFVSALLSGLMGASVDEIVADYMVSYENYYGVEKGTERYDLISKIITNIFAELNEGKAVTDKTLRKVSENYLLKTVGLSSDQVKAIKGNLSDSSIKLEGTITFKL